ncbi:hypothetical protein EX30DRAFT_383543 [Ascodesmis nigricans]|uniref:Lysine-specific metallo-endopeptidase domain-containing protein n=1 Tax=Ascodesmis nigricans TaxID=341454 RepID=A0A4S2MNN8_9PEZI|nr:hypothetical protein EX30DRAFT_383543 [Ascodesmis nigricans]
MRPFLCSLSMTLVVLVTNSLAMPMEQANLQGVAPLNLNFIDEKSCANPWAGFREYTALKDVPEDNRPIAQKLRQEAREPVEPRNINALHHLKKAAKESFEWMHTVDEYLESELRHDELIASSPAASTRGKTSDLSTKIPQISDNADAMARSRGQAGRIGDMSYPKYQLGEKEPPMDEKDHAAALRIGSRLLVEQFFGSKKFTTGTSSGQLLVNIRSVLAYYGLQFRNIPGGGREIRVPDRPTFAGFFCGDNNLVPLKPAPFPGAMHDTSTDYVIGIGRRGCEPKESGKTTLAYNTRAWPIDLVRNSNAQTLLNQMDKAKDIIYLCTDLNAFTGLGERAIRYRMDFMHSDEAFVKLLFTDMMNRNGEGWNAVAEKLFHITIIHELMHMCQWDKICNENMAQISGATEEERNKDAAKRLAVAASTVYTIDVSYNGRASYGWAPCVLLGQLAANGESDDVVRPCNNADSIANFVVATYALIYASHADKNENRPAVIRGFDHTGKPHKLAYDSKRSYEDNMTAFKKLFPKQIVAIPSTGNLHPNAPETSTSTSMVNPQTKVVPGANPTKANPAREAISANTNTASRGRPINGNSASGATPANANALLKKPVTKGP